ncbi:MAG TPA: recombinase RecT [Nevskia sp.]|nr:recombinase RecT [Nevskia sp.]
MANQTSVSQLRGAQPAATREPTSPSGKLMHFLERHKDQLTAALPKHLTADRMGRLAITAFSQNPQLQQCEPRSIFGSVIVSCQMGLEIGVLGQGFLVPYKRNFKDEDGNWQSRMEAQFVPGWMGIVDLVSRTGRASAWTGAVFEGDDFDYALGDRPFVSHRPQGEDDPAKITHVYAVGRVNGAEWPIIEVWPIRRVWKHRDKHNKVGKSHYSFANPEMYARKVPLLQVCKYLPKSVELTAALNAEHAAEIGGRMTFDGEFSLVEHPERPSAEGGAAAEQGEQAGKPTGGAGSAGGAEQKRTPGNSPDDAFDAE